MRTRSTNQVGSSEEDKNQKETIKVTLPKKMVAIPCNNTMFMITSLYRIKGEGHREKRSNNDTLGLSIVTPKNSATGFPISSSAESTQQKIIWEENAGDLTFSGG